MLVEIPFPTATHGDNRNKFQGESKSVAVDPSHVAAINRTFDRIVVLLKNGRMFVSETPKTTLAVKDGKLVLPGEKVPDDAPAFDNMPDQELLRKWYAETLELINRYTGGYAEDPEDHYQGNYTAAE